MSELRDRIAWLEGRAGLERAVLPFGAAGGRQDASGNGGRGPPRCPRAGSRRAAAQLWSVTRPDLFAPALVQADSRPVASSMSSATRNPCSPVSKRGCGTRDSAPWSPKSRACRFVGGAGEQGDRDDAFPGCRTAAATRCVTADRSRTRANCRLAAFERGISTTLADTSTRSK